jgi:hypothetical protein
LKLDGEEEEEEEKEEEEKEEKEEEEEEEPGADYVAPGKKRRESGTRCPASSHVGTIK